MTNAAVAAISERFWAKVERRGPDECWEWQASRGLGGYGRFQAFGENYAHRVAYELAVGPIPSGLLVLHSCDNPPCCNPRHLFVGTQVDNVRDAIAKGRTARGERHYATNLIDADVRVIRWLADNAQATTAQIALAWRLSPGQVRQIVRRKRWTSLPEEVQE